MSKVSSKDVLIEKFRKSPDAFAYVMCGIKPTEYQKKILRDDSRRIVVVCSRQVGKSTIIAVKALWRAWCWPKQDILIIAPTFRQADIVYSKIYEWVIANPILRNDCVRLTISKLMFENGSIIRCLPAGHTGESIRGYSATMVIVDEAQSVPDEVFVSIIPAVMVKQGQLILLGTPSHGKQGFLWQAWCDPNFSKHRVTAYESPFITKDEIEKFRQLKGEVAFRRELMAEFYEADDLFFNMEFVRRSAVLTRRVEPQEGWTYTMGIDWSRYGNDMNAIVVVGQHEDIEHYEMHNYWIRAKRPISDVIGWAIQKIQLWKPTVVVCDATSGWGSAVDMLREKVEELGLDVSVQDFNFAKKKLRDQLYWNLRRLIEDGKLQILRDEKFISQFESFRVKYSSVGNETIKKEGKHDDIVDALAMACWGMTRVIGNRVLPADFMDLDKLLTKQAYSGIFSRGLRV